MTTVLEWFNTFGPYFMTFTFQVLCIISEKKFRVVLRLCRNPIPLDETLTLTLTLHQNASK